MSPTRSELAGMIDHTLLKPESTADDVAALVAEAQDLGVLAVCISPSQLPVSADGLVVATVCGFPSGAHPTEVKVADARAAVAAGADEVDMVINLGLAAANRWQDVTADIEAVRDAVPGVLKVIIESALLSDAAIVAACGAAERAGANFVKTSTGFHPAGGADAHSVQVMADTVGGRLGVKASGGIRTADAALAMVAAGATRLGLSGSRAVLDGIG